jgi:YYY domain-containing protein
MEFAPHLGIEYALLWWLMLEVIGVVALPLTFRLCRHLPDRGYALAKPLGLILINYALWMLSTLGFLRNTWGNIFLVTIGVAVLSVLFYAQGRKGDGADDVDLGTWLGEHRWTVIASELVFTLALALWVAYQMYDPNIAITEKPMEFAFLNAITRSERFPAYDPWMSGYNNISYYHFGYIMVATLGKFLRIPTSFAFNLGITMLFALTVSGAFSVAYNLVYVVARKRNRDRAVGAAITYGAIAAIMIPLMGNLEGALEFAHANGIGVTVEEQGNVSGPFWEWIDVKNLTKNGTISGTWHPTDGWWWWRASRVIHDKGLTGNDMEVIDEFPAFSFLLGDMHPHVLAYPFVLLVLGLAFNLLLSDRAPTTAAWWLLCLSLGALGFLNTWDMPFYFFVVVVAYGLNRYLHPDLESRSLIERGVAWIETRFLGHLRQHAVQVENGFLRRVPWLRQVIFRALELGIASVVLYLPSWLYGLPKAGSGILPNLFNVTRLAQLFLMFGTFFVVLVALLIVLFREMWRKGQGSGRLLLRQGLPIWVVTMGFLPLLLAVVVVIALIVPSARGRIEATLNDPLVQEFLGPQTVGSLLQISLRIRLGLLPQQLRDIRMPAGPWTFLFLSLLIAAIVFWLVRTTFPRWFNSAAAEIEAPSPSVLFALLMAFTGLMLIFGVEFVYLQDAFGSRMNTVFKFYFQAWALLGLAAAFGLYYVLESCDLVTRLLLSVVFAAFLFAGLLYPLGASISRTGNFAGPPTLDGVAFVARDRPEEYAATQWLNENVSGHPVIVEAVRGSFAYEHARVSSRTGLPAVMGWTGHEGQWREPALGPEIAEREEDVKALYRGSVQDARRIIEKYDVRYVYVGYLERAEFGNAVEKFRDFMDVAYRIGDTVIYERR